MLVLSIQQTAELPGQLLRRLPINYLQMLAFAAALVALMLVIGLPITILSTIGALLSPILAQIVFRRGAVYCNWPDDESDVCTARHLFCAPALLACNL